MSRTAPPFDQLVANSPVRPLCQLASGIDALYLSGRAELPKRFVARLEDCRSWAGEAKRPAPCEIGPMVFGIAPHGLTLDDAHRFVCRADARRTYEVAGTLTGFEFGSRTTKTFMARLYDKTADLAAKDNGWWLDVWGERYVPGQPVHRLEFEIGRQGLVEFDLNTPEQVMAAAGELWAYATTDWLTYRSPTADQTRSRWPAAPEWLQVQRATLGHEAVGIERLRLSRRAASVEKLLPGLTGYLASLGALIGTRDIDDTVRAVGHHLHTYEIVSRTPFAERVARRRSELDLR